MLRDAWLIAAKDLRVEWRSRIVINQVMPFALLVLMLFGFALDPDGPVLARATPGLFWVAVLFVTVLTVERTFSIESSDGVRDGLRLVGLEPSGIFLGKFFALALQLIVVEIVLLLGVVLLYGRTLSGLVLLVSTLGVATAGIAAAGILYGVLSVGLRVRSTLLPFLLLPVLAPVLIGATRATEAALDGVVGDGWPWFNLLGVFALVYIGAGILTFGSLMEES
ncbi:MAG: heme exporter protein CcmB [Acidimicrobiia bacterium]